MNEGKQEANLMVEAALFNRAIGYSHPEAKVFTYEGDIIEHEVMKHYPPETNAIKLWLTNKDPNNWKEKTNVEHDVGESIKPKTDPIEVEERIKLLNGEK